MTEHHHIQSRQAGPGGGPWRAGCSCGWQSSHAHTARLAADLDADAHYSAARVAAASGVLRVGRGDER